MTDQQPHRELAAIVRDWCKRHYSSIPDEMRNELQHAVQRCVLKADLAAMQAEVEGKDA